MPIGFSWGLVAGAMTVGLALGFGWVLGTRLANGLCNLLAGKSGG